MKTHLLTKYNNFFDMKNFNEYLIEKLVIDSDVKVSDKPKVKAPWIDASQRADIDKMNYYHNKGSKPLRLVNSIKDDGKLKRRFGVAVRMKWNEAIREFGKALVSRGIFSQEQVDAYIEENSK